MLDTDTKRRIDTARNILVGKVPDPKSQVEQITIALIYKFMDDMDADAEELGGKRRFFAGDYARYGWAKLMRPGLGGHEMLNLYAEGITKMPENPGIPPLFREMFKNAYLPYRDPETLKAFLKIIDEFKYDHSERLGDAFEYLLSVLGSQGDAGQFRTPRHIIDFIVEVVDPKKNETVLDPACGTAGFLISSYKHILKANTDAKGHCRLTPDERAKLAANFRGFDISPDMVRLSLVNLYLHGFPDPHIYEYDTLTSLDRWNEHADVILANPPFMSPKGGIKPHNRFGVQSKRSEVLFVNYMAEHLTPNGRAGIIVPEGIIFQSQSAYKQLRKLLVEDYLVAVVSLPAGVFNPYSGVKTSILILDKSLAKQADSIAFFKVGNDGFNLGAQRRPIDKNDLPQVCTDLDKYLRRLRARKSVEDIEPTFGLVVAKEKVAESGDYNLSGERYREVLARASAYPLHHLGELLEIQSGYPFKSDKFDSERGFPIIRIRDIKPNRTETKYNGEYDTSYVVRDGDLLIGMDGEFNSAIWRGGDALLNQRVCRLREFKGCLKEYVARLIPGKLKEIEDGTYAVTVKHISTNQIADIEIPVPPLEVQKEIVAEVEGYQKVIDGAQAVLDSYLPHILIDPDWPMVAIGDLCTIERGASPRPIHAFITEAPDGVNWVKIGDAEVHGKYITKTKQRVTPAGAAKSRRVKPGDFLLTNSMSFGRPYIMATDGCIHDGWLMLRDHSDRVDKDFLYNVLSSPLVFAQFERAATGGVVRNLNSAIVRQVQIPLPPLQIQRAIAAEIEAEQALVNANRELITRFEKKIQATLARVWGEEPKLAAGKAREAA
jgi:type I restriction enzyme M protein